MEQGLFTNRELASLFWLGVVSAWLLLRHRRATLSACRKLMRSARPVAALLGLYGVWIGVVTWVGARLGLWDHTLLKDTLLWILLSGLGLFLGTVDALKHPAWFRKAFLATIGATAILEFVVNAKSFALVVEVLLQPLAFLTIALPVVARDPEHRPVRSLAGWIGALIGFVAVSWTALAAIGQWPNIDQRQLIREALLPAWLTLGALVLLYPFALYMAYEQLLNRMRWRAGGRSVWRQQLAVLAYAGPGLSVMRDLHGAVIYDIVHAGGFRAAVRAIRQVRRKRRAEREAERAAAQRLIDNAGSTGGTTTANASTSGS